MDGSLNATGPVLINGSNKKNSTQQAYMTLGNTGSPTKKGGLSSQLTQLLNTQPNNNVSHQQQFSNQQVRKMYNHNDIAQFGSAETKLKQL